MLGVTGGVGAGKSTVLGFLEDRYGADVIELDRVAREMQQPGGECYGPMVRLLGEECLREDGQLDRAAAAEKIYRSPQLREKINEIVHPAVKRRVLRHLRRKEEDAVSAAGRTGTEESPVPRALTVIESALLIDDHYEEICDEIWYIHAAEQKRRERLKASRGYSDERIDRMLGAQRSEESFRENAQTVIDNTDDFVQNTFGQIDRALSERGFFPTEETGRI